MVPERPHHHRQRRTGEEGIVAVAHSAFLRVLFMFTKSADGYYYDQDALRDPLTQPITATSLIGARAAAITPSAR